MKTLLITIMLLITTLAYSQSRYEFIGAKIDQQNTISLNVGQLNSNGDYSGMQGTMPLITGHTFLMSAELGKSLLYMNSYDTKKHVGLIGYGIAGLYVNDFGLVHGNIWRLNYGVGIQSFYKGISIGINYTRWERLGIKLGIYFDSLDY